MKISHRLIFQSIAAGVALAGVGALGLLGVRNIQQELYVMTGNILPVKHMLLEIEQSKEQTIGAMLELSYAESTQEASTLDGHLQARLDKLHTGVEKLGQKKGFEELDIAEFHMAREDILENVSASINGYASYLDASAQARKSLERVSTNVANVAGGIDAIAENASTEAQQARNRSNDLILGQQEVFNLGSMLSRLNVLMYSTDAIESKYKIPPLLAAFDDLANDVNTAQNEASDNEEIIAVFEEIHKILNLFNEEKKGLFATKSALLAKEKRAKLTYRKLRRKLAGLIDETTVDVNSIAEDYEFEIMLANEDMEAALTFSSDPSGITGINQKLIINTRDMQIELQNLLAAADATSLRKEYGLAVKRLGELNIHTQALSTELKKLELETLLKMVDSITSSLTQVQKSIQTVYNGQLTVFESRETLKQSISTLKRVSDVQREKGQELISNINTELDAVLNKVDEQVSQSTSFIIIISLIAIAASAAFSFITTRAIIQRLKRALQVAESVSTGDLSPVEPSVYKDEISSVLDALARMVNMLENSVRQIRSASASVNKGAEEISTGNTALTERNGQQAIHLNDTASSTKKINELVQNGATAVQKVSEHSQTAATAAQQGREVVQDAMHTMSNIEKGANEISNIISVIDSIAFQTNILALNAAVEASRAGEVGRGFAVVASEVRALASKSKEAANQIREIIDNNVADVEAGSALVNNAGQHMEDVVLKVDDVKKLIEHISATSLEQVESISHIDSSVDEIESMTHENTSLSEKTSDAASNLLNQARTLDHAVSVFKL